MENGQEISSIKLPKITTWTRPNVDTFSSTSNHIPISITSKKGESQSIRLKVRGKITLNI